MELLAQLHHVEEMTMGKKYEHKSLKIQGLFRMKADQLVTDQWRQARYIRKWKSENFINPPARRLRL